MGQDNGWLVASPGTRVVLGDGRGNRVEGFLELVDPELGVAWIREQSTGERRMVTRVDFPRALGG